MIAAIRSEPTFLYPKSRQFPFDEVCDQIVRALEERNWDVPGINVEFDVYGSGDEKYRMVHCIKGDDFKLWFCRIQGRLNLTLNDIAAVTEIVIPKKELHVYEDESGPTLYVYSGKNWSEDKERFLTGSKLDSRRREEPRWYLQYKGACNCDARILGAQMTHTHQGDRSPLLIVDHEVNKGEPRQYRTWDVFHEFTLWLKNDLLAKILEQPAADERIDVFREDITPYPDNIEPIFCFGEADDARRVYQGTLDPTELEPSKRYGLMGSGYRLLSERNDGTVPKIAHDGFRWCGFGQITDEAPVDSLEVPGHNWQYDNERFVFRIKPNRADGIYVADHAQYEQRRKELVEETEAKEPGRKRFTDAEVADFSCARARTIVPITEYDGSFEQPIVLVNRELDFDEVELVSGPWPECQYVEQLVRRGPKLSNLFERAMLAHEERYLAFRDKSKETAYTDALNRLMAPLVRDEEIAEAVEAYGKQVYRRPKLSEFMERLLVAGREMRDMGLLEFNQ